ncbi:MAG: aminoacyl-histidine dipeptidase [Candidatus Aminicenantes bacterium]|nr:aminoacyl-histidine dipeptidase [Candidatus Aminicenantes bacterium]
MASPLAGLAPELLWKHFDRILGIPRCSGSEKPLGDYIVSRAKALGLVWKRDKVGNVVVRKPGAPGRDSAAFLALQGHMDMVCEKNSDVVHDFAKDPIIPVLKDGWIQARGTSLGSDNGIAVAAFLAVMEDASLVHGPLEFLFTVDEERGLTGARSIPAGFLQSRRMLNLDSEEEGTYTIGCSGGADSDFTFPLKRLKAAAGKSLRLSIMGLRGGHSGLDIHLGRANAIKILARVLFEAGSKFSFALGRLEGGSKHNAIPREARADLVLAPAEEARFRAFLDRTLADVRAEFGSVEADLAWSLDPLPGRNFKPMTEKSRRGLLAFLLACPHGVLRMHPEIAGLTETSNNLAIVRTTPSSARILTSSRSSVGPALASVRNSLKALAHLAGASVRQPEGYPGWAPNLHSSLLAEMQAIHVKVFGAEARVVAVHAGLECGIIGEKFPGMDMISFGPNIRHPHSPDERVEVASVRKFYDFLLAVLRELS